IEPAEAEGPIGASGAVYVDGPGFVKDMIAKGGGTLVDRASDANAIVICPLGDDATAAALAAGYDPKRIVAIDALFPDKFVSGARATVMGSPITETHSLDVVHGALLSSGMRVTRIADSPGFIAQRVVANIVNTACEVAQRRIAAPEDIEEGVKRGLGYPVGPFAMGDGVGGRSILQILRRLQDLTGDPRYRPSLWLRRR